MHKTDLHSQAKLSGFLILVLPQALVAVLAHGAAPELIYLDLRGNPLTEAGTTALVSPHGITPHKKEKKKKSLRR